MENFSDKIKEFPLIDEIENIKNKGYNITFSARSFDSGVVYDPEKQLVMVSADLTMRSLHNALVRLGERL